ncbi:MAG: hypothetical protein JNK49_10670 [Planctomycetes bacterium]|nr:hypothetical protein [Planctomycetota bacterium]
MIAPAGFVELRAAAAIGWLLAELAPHGLQPFWANLTPLPGAKGRGGVGSLVVAGRELVVRPYQRGGALGKLLRDRYPSPQRARNELAVLAELRAQGVPVVAPIAAVAQRRGAFWRLRLCTERVPEALPLPAFLAAHPELRRHTATAVGTLVRLAFAAGLRHPDLHLDNVLCAPRGDRVRAVLVDLDRAKLRGPLTTADTDAMLSRLLRHLVRHQQRLAATPSRTEMLRFLQALGLPRSDRAQAWQRIANHLRRDLNRRRWFRRR